MRKEKIAYFFCYQNKYMKTKERMTFKNGMAVVITKMHEIVKKDKVERYYNFTIVMQNQLAVKKLVRFLKYPKVTKEDCMYMLEQVKNGRRVQYNINGASMNEIRELFDGYFHVSDLGFIFFYENNNIGKVYKIEVCPNKITYLTIKKLGSLPAGKNGLLEDYLLEWKKAYGRNVVKNYNI